MKVSELKEKAPLSDVYELNPDSKYIVFVDSTLPRELLRQLSKELKATIFAFHPTAQRPKIFEIGE